MDNKKQSRLRRAARTRAIIRDLGADRLTVHRTPRHIYAQVFRAGTHEVVAAASSLDKDLREEMPNGGNVEAARRIGQRVAERALAAGITQVAFDRAGFKYHGRVKALADAAREAGLQF